MKFTQCPNCNGRGETRNAIDNELYKCRVCGGHKKAPAPPEENQGKAAYYYQKIDWRYGYKSQRIAVLTPDIDRPSCYRLQIYAPFGPVTHFTDPVQGHWPIMSNLEEYIRADAFSPRTLDAWSRTAFWKEGVRDLYYLSLEELLRHHEHTSDLAWKIIDSTPDRDKRIVQMEEVKKLHLPYASVW